MMKKMKGSSLIVVNENIIVTYHLDSKRSWDVGRPTRDNQPDIQLSASTVSRKHGCILNYNGCWAYIDNASRNGTVYNGKVLKNNRFGFIPTKWLEHGDILEFGKVQSDGKGPSGAWSCFLERDYGDDWKKFDTHDMTCIKLMSDNTCNTINNAKTGTVVEFENGIAVYMGNTTYVIGDVLVVG